MDQLTLHVRNCRVIKTEPSETKDITSFLKRIEDSSQSGPLILEGWTSWFNKKYHAILAKDEAKLYLFLNDDNSVENKCQQTILLRAGFIRKTTYKKFTINTTVGKKHFIAHNRKERDIWISKITESIRYAQDNDPTQTVVAAYFKKDIYVNSQKILVIDDNKEQGVIDPDIHQVRCCVEVSGNEEDKQIIILLRLSYERTIKRIVEFVLAFLAKEYHPMLFSLIAVSSKSCTNKTIYALNGISNLEVKLDTFDSDDVENKGLHLVVKSIYYHTINTSITCEYMQNGDAVDEEKEQKLDPVICPIYHEMIENKEFNNEYLTHIEDETHFKDEFQEKPLCPHAQNCQAFKETEHGQSGIDYKCHMALYRHPPASIKRNNHESNMKEFIMNANKYANHPLYVPTEHEFKQRDDETGFYHQLLMEVKRNGFEEDLGKRYDGSYLIEIIVKRKMQSKRHVLMGSPLTKGQMLALILMTGSEKCCVDIGYQHRKANYKRWKWFDYCLYWAIYILSQKEFGQFKVYSGLNNVYLPQQVVKDRYFMTYTSTSWQEHVAMKFMGQKGILLEIDANFKNDKNVYCCDVSWLSKYPDECEILFARSIGGWSSNAFSCEILDQRHGIQRVLLKKQESVKDIKKRRIDIKVEKHIKDWDIGDCINWINSMKKGSKFPQKLKNKFIAAIEGADVCDGELFYHCDNVDELCELLNMTKNKVICKRLYQYIAERIREDDTKLVQKYEFDSFDEETRNVVCLDSNYDDITFVLGNDDDSVFQKVKQAVNVGDDIVIVANGMNRIIDVEVKIEKAYV